MKLSIKPVALAVTMAIASVAAHAQTMPSFGSTSPSNTSNNGTNQGLYLAVWDDGTKNTDLVDLTANYADVAYITSAYGTTSALTTPTSAFKTVANPTGAAGTVLQLDLGTISNFSTIFPSVTSATNYVIVAAENTGNGNVTSAPLNFSYAGGAFTSQDSAILGESSNWAATANTGLLTDTTSGGTANYSAIGGPLTDGTEGTPSTNFAVNVGTAAGFYNYARTGSRNPLVADTYTYNGQQGFWFLSSTGDLSWNLVSSASAVPLPAAVWLFASGLIGLGVIGRRRQSGLGAAV